MLSHTHRRGALAVLAIMLVLSVAVPFIAAPALATTAASAPAGPSSSSLTNLVQENTTDQNEPTDASQVRIEPDVPNEDYVNVETVKSDARFNTSGGFAAFTLSRPVQSARIAQPHARARVIANGYAIRVDYEDQAAPRDATSLYNLELFFPDGSEKTVELFATNTAIAANAQISPKYAEFINYVEDKASDHDFEESPAGALAYVKDREQKADWFEGLWSGAIETFIALRLAQAFSPFDWVAILGGILIFSIYMSRKHGWMLRLQQTVVSKAELMREAARQDYEERRNTAAKHSLTDVDGIGTNAVRYWRELGVETVDDIIEVTCKGMHAVDEEGNILYDTNGEIIWAHSGVKNLLNVEPLTERKLREETWLKPLILEGRLRSTTVLSNIEQALRVAEEQYSRGNEVQQTRRQVEELIRVMRGERDHDDYKTARRQANSVRHSTTADRDRDMSATGAD